MDGLSGLASGVDTAGIVDKLMALDRQGRSRLTLRQTAITAQQGVLRDLKTKLEGLRSAAGDLASATTWGESQSVESSDPARLAAVRTGGAPIGGISVQVLGLAASARKTYAWTESSAATTLSLDGGTGPQTVAVPAGATSADVASIVNGQAGLPVYAAVVGGQLVLSSRATGAAADFTVTGDQLSAPSAVVAGRDARYLVDDDPTVRQSPTNVVEDAIPGVRLTFKGVMAEPAGVVVGAPGVDRERVRGEVKAFVEAYNGLVSATRAKLEEKKVRDPTTTGDYAKGQLLGDSGLSAMLSKLRLGLGHAYTGVGNSAALDDLADIGITTGRPGAATEAAKDGLLVLDEAKLMEAVDADAQGVRRLLGGTATAAFAQDLEATADRFADVLGGRIEAQGRQSRAVADELTRADTRLAAKEKRLKAQFAAMEAALNASQTQGAWLQGQLAALPSWR